MGENQLNRRQSKSRRTGYPPALPLRSTSHDDGRWQSVPRVFFLSLASTLLLLTAFPPLNIFAAAWVAPVGWLVICQDRRDVTWRGYFAIWLCGWVFWLVILHSIRLAFWALIFGWLVMSLYLALYLPLFIAITRALTFRWRWPFLIAAPIAWTGLEALRSTLFTGYAANSLAHSQAFQPVVIQVVDQLSAGGLSFLMLLFAAALCKSIGAMTRGERLPAAVSLGTGALLVLMVLAYGTWRLRQADHLMASSKPLLRCLLLQENTPSIFEMNPDLDEYWDRSRSAWTSYLNLCRAAVREGGQVDLVVWPESTFTEATPYIQADFPENQVSEELQEELRSFGFTVDHLLRYIDQSQKQFEMKVRVAMLAARGLEPFDELPADPGPHLLVGCDHVLYGVDGVQRYNAALWIPPGSEVTGTYAKMHLVMFGEYIPLRSLLSWLGDWFSFAGVQPGSAPAAFDIAGARVAPNICFESMMPQLIRRQVRQLSVDGASPDVLVNLTNDSWFKGTSMLDHHLASSILCSVENRRPLLVAANTGISAEIDGSGRVRNRSERMTARAILAEPYPDARFGLVQAVGYPLPWACGVAVATIMVVTPVAGVLRRWRRKSGQKST